MQASRPAGRQARTLTRWLSGLLACLACALRLCAVEYPTIGVGIETNGSVLRITNSTAPNLDATTTAVTNLAFFHGFTTNNTPSSSNGITVTWLEKGFDQNGAFTWDYLTAYGTIILRRPYPESTSTTTTNDIQLSEVTNAVTRVYLSRQLSSSASNIQVSIRQGAIASTNGAAYTNCMATNMAVASESTQVYGKLCGNWATGVPMFTRLSSLRLRAVAFHKSGRNFMPVALIRFITTGLTSGVKVTNNVTRWSVDWAFNRRAQFNKDINPGEAIADVDLSGFTALEDIRSDLQIYAWTGDTVIDTTTDTFPIGHPREAAILNMYDPNNAHSTVIAVVDETSGSDSLGRCQTNTLPQDIPSTNYFLTIGGALNQSAASNLTFYGHSNTSGSIIYVKSGTTNYPGANITVTAIPTVAPIIRPYPGETFTLTTVVGSGSMKRVRFEDAVNTAWRSAQIPFNAYGYVSFERSTSIVSVSTGPYLNVTNSQFIHCTIGSFAASLAAGAGGSTTAHSLRGCWLKGINNGGVFRTWIGNYHGITNDGPAYSVSSGQSADSSPEGNRILYNNFFGGEHLVGAMMAVISNTQDRVCVIQNVFEKCLAGERSGTIATTGSSYTNFFGLQNLFEGGRIADYASEQNETTYIPRVGFSIKNTIWAYPGQKMDTDGASPNGIRFYSSSECSHMVDGEGNFYIRNNVTTTTTAFRPLFSGMYTYDPGYTNVDNFVQFVDRQAATSGTSTAGDGKYWFLNQSPAFRNIKTAKILPFDISGKPRSADDPPGPYVVGNPKRVVPFL